MFLLSSFVCVCVLFFLIVCVSIWGNVSPRYGSNGGSENSKCDELKKKKTFQTYITNKIALIKIHTSTHCEAMFSITAGTSTTENAKIKPEVSSESPALNDSKVQTLVLDATPLITQHYSTLSKFANNFFTTPTIFNEIKDEHARRNLELWGDKLILRHPKPESIKRVTDFSRLTGDYSVLSSNDLHILALTYELEVELNNGDWRLRKVPGEKLPYQIRAEEKAKEVKKDQAQDEEDKETNEETTKADTEGKKRKQRRRGGKKQREKREAALQAELDKEDQEESIEDLTQERIRGAPVLQNEKARSPEQKEEPKKDLDLIEDYKESDDDGEWITEDNLIEAMIKDSGEKTEGATSQSKIKVALATQDFAVQNTSLQLGLNLMNVNSGLQIKRVRNYMLRCHACFTMIPIPKNGRPKHFCSRCGGNTLIRCAVSVDSKTGEIKPHLKANFEWHRKGERYTLPSPLSKNTQRRMGNKGFVHNKSNKQKEFEEPILREDQKEYQKALKDDDWLRRQNEKILNDYIGGGSADNFISPFVAQSYRSSGVKIGKGRYANATRKKK